MTAPTAAMLVIGDEILSGRTRDANMNHLAKKLTEKGVRFLEARVVSDDHDAIVSAVRALRDSHDHVFTSGGIGPTHDDITAEAVADAFSTPIDIRADALAILQDHYDRGGIEMNDARRRMARVPDCAKLIDNPISAAPGFTIGNVHVMAGVPAIFEAMVATVLATLDGGAPLMSETIRLELPEGEIAGPLSELAARYPGLSFGSYPYFSNGNPGANVVIRGTDAAEIQSALTELCERLPGGT